MLFRSLDSSNVEFPDCKLAGKWFDTTDLESCVNTQSENLALLGYLKPTIVIDSLVVDDFKQEVSAKMSVAIDDLAVLSEVRWVGLSKTGSRWLENVANLQQGMTLNESNIRKSTLKLVQTKLFDDISEPEVYLRDGNWGLSYSLTERPLTFFDLIVG